MWPNCCAATRRQVDPSAPFWLEAPPYCSQAAVEHRGVRCSCHSLTVTCEICFSTSRREGADA